MTKFTEGPWSIDQYGAIVDKNGETIRIRASVAIPMSMSAPIGDEARPNAHLIAAAPCNYHEHQALLDIVKAAIKAGDWKVDGACDPEQQIGRSETALAKARGETC